MKEYELVEPEFVDMGIALRINLYRAQTTTQDGIEKVQENAGGVESDALEIHKSKEMCLKCTQNVRKRELRTRK